MIPDGYRIDPVNGIVYGKRGRQIVGRDHIGYCRVMSNGNFMGYAHRLIWESVNGPMPPDLVINHINGIKTDNRISNLELVTVGQNSRHAHATGLVNNQGHRNGRAKLTESDVVSIKKGLAAGEDQAHLAKSFGVSQATILAIKTGQRWGHVHG